MTDQGARVAELDVAAANLGDVRDPYTAYEEARARAPVARVTHFEVPATMVYGFTESEQVLKDWETFSARINGRWMRPFLGRTILELDGPQHMRYRSLIAHAFRPRAVAQWEENLIRPTAHEVIDRFAARGRAEMVRELAWQFPVRVFARILGVPDVDFAAWGRWAIELETAATNWKRGASASREVRDYFSGVVDARRREPDGSLISDLVHAEIEGERLPDDIIHGFIRLLVPAGAGTTYRLTGNLLWGLLTHPEQLEAVLEDRSLVPAAVEETLRWESPVQFAAREATRDAEVGGMQIPAGQPVTIALGAANRDPARWERPAAFDIGREMQPNVAFGSGEHYCLGAHLARLEATVALNAILDRLDDLRLDPGDADPHVVGFAFRSPTAVPVAFRAES